MITIVGNHQTKVFKWMIILTLQIDFVGLSNFKMVLKLSSINCSWAN